jgi:hypothetical protein
MSPSGWAGRRHAKKRHVCATCALGVGAPGRREIVQEVCLTKSAPTGVVQLTE